MSVAWRRVLLSLGVTVLAIVPGMALDAAESCTGYRVTYVPWTPHDPVIGEGYSPAEATAAWVSAWNAQGFEQKSTSYPDYYREYVATGSCGSSTSCGVLWTNYDGPDPNSTCAGGSCAVNVAVNLTVTNLGAVECPVDPCEGMADLPAVGGGLGPGSGELCRTEDADGNPVPEGGSCRVVKDGAGLTTSLGWFGHVRFTGESCGDPEEAEEAAAEAGNCISSSSGTVCVSRSQKNCGKVNGESVCLDSVPGGGCTILSGGGAVCGPTAPVPEDESENPLDADATLQLTDGAGDTTNYNYYSQSTVSSAAGGVSGTDNGSGSGGSGEGGEGTGLDDLEGGEMGEVGSFGAITSSFVSRVQGSDLVLAAGGVGGSMGSGSCPSWSWEISFGPFGDVDFDLTFMCDLWESVAGIISAVMLAAWAFMSVRIVMSA